MVHVSTLERALEAMAFGADGLVHVWVLLISSTAPAGPPPSVFIAPEEWTQVEIQLEDFTTATPEIIAGLAFVAEGPVGTFAFEVDEVEVR